MSMMKADGFDECIIGIGQRFNDSFIVYDAEKVIESLSNDMGHEEAIDYFNYNILGAWVGRGTPCFLDFSASVDDYEE